MEETHTTTNPTDWETRKELLRQEWRAEVKQWPQMDAIGSGSWWLEKMEKELQKAKEAGVREGREEEHMCLLNSLSGSLELPHRCLSCGAPGLLTWRKTIELNAIGGWCPECVDARDNASSPH